MKNILIIFLFTSVFCSAQQLSEAKKIRLNKIAKESTDSLIKFIAEAPMSVITLKSMISMGFTDWSIKYDTLLEDATLCYIILSERKSLDRETLFRFAQLSDFTDKYKEAIVSYTDIMNNTPNKSGFASNRMIMTYRGECKFKLEDYYGAISDYTFAINNIDTQDFKHIGNDALSHKMRGKCYGMLRNSSAAIKDFTEAINENDNGETYYFRGIMYIMESNFEKGCLDLSKAGESGYSKAYDSIKKFCNK